MAYTVGVEESKLSRGGPSCRSAAANGHTGNLSDGEWSRLDRTKIGRNRGGSKALRHSPGAMQTGGLTNVQPPHAVAPNAKQSLRKSC